MFYIRTLSANNSFRNILWSQLIHYYWLVRKCFSVFIWRKICWLSVCIRQAESWAGLTMRPAANLFKFPNVFAWKCTILEFRTYFSHVQYLTGWAEARCQVLAKVGASRSNEGGAAAKVGRLNEATVFGTYSLNGCTNCIRYLVPDSLNGWTKWSVSITYIQKGRG